MRYLTWLLVLLIFGCTSRPQDQAVDANILPDRQQARNNLKAQAEEVGRAAVEEDHAKMAELTLPALVEKFGGRAAYVKQLQSSAAGIRGQGFRLKKITIGEPSALIQAAGEVYAVVPAELEVNGPKGARGRQPSYLIAVSHDGGVRWKFIDGFGAGGDRGKLTALLPNFPEQLRLPAAQPPVWENQPVPLTRSPGPPKSFARAGFTFDYPPSWTLNDKGKDHDPDHQFTIDASLGAMIMFVIADAKLDPAKTLAIMVQALSKRMANVMRTDFDRWGKYNGSGAVLRGKTLGLIPTTIRVFVFNAGEKTINVTEDCPDDEQQQLAPGFRTIEDSFRVLQEGK